jgi:hypothetical protein
MINLALPCTFLHANINSFPLMVVELNNRRLQADKDRHCGLEEEFAQRTLTKF